MRRALQALDAFRIQSLTRKGCMARGLAETPCAGKIVRAHVVSKARTLKPIARRGHVLRHGDRFDFDRPPFVRFEFTEVGIGRATTFHGFCARHDRDLFSCVDDEDFAARPDQCFALAYRSVAQEVHSRAGSERFLNGVAERMPGSRTNQAQVMAQEMLRGQQTARDGILLTAAGFSRLLRGDAGDAVRHLLVSYDGVLPVAFGGAFAPVWDFEDREIQSMLPGAPSASYIVLSTTTSGGRTHVLLSWLAEASAGLRPLLDQIGSMPVATAGNAVLEMAMEGIGTVVFAPDWVDGLHPRARDRLQGLLVHGATYAPGPTPWIGLQRCGGVPEAVRLGAVC